MLILRTQAGEVCHLACDLKAKSFLPQLRDESGSPWPEVGVQWPCPTRASVPLTPDSWAAWVWHHCPPGLSSISSRKAGMGGVDLPSPSLPPAPSLTADSSYSSSLYLLHPCTVFHTGCWGAQFLGPRWA